MALAQVESWLRVKVEASDLVQQTMLETHRGFERFEGRSEKEWLTLLLVGNGAAIATWNRGGVVYRACAAYLSHRS